MLDRSVASRKCLRAPPSRISGEVLLARRRAATYGESDEQGATAMKQWISFPRREGSASKQAHADLPEGTFEREISKEGFFGPATQMYHRHPPTGWTAWEGPLRPRAFDLGRIASASTSPWQATDFLGNAHLRIRLWRVEGRMEH